MTDDGAQDLKRGERSVARRPESRHRRSAGLADHDDRNAHNSRLRIRAAWAEPPASRREARSMICSPSRALLSIRTRKASAGSARISRVSSRKSSSAAPQIGQVIRQPSIQLRSRAPRVRTFWLWRCAQARQSCKGRLIATMPLRTLPPRDCVMLRNRCDELRKASASRAAWRRVRLRSRSRTVGTSMW